MLYIYDITLNLNKKIIEFFEWEDKDNLCYIRKIPLYKISTNMLFNMINHTIEVKKEFLLDIKNKTIFNNSSEYKYLSLFSDGKLVVAIVFNENGNNDLISKLFIDEETEIIFLVERLSETKIEYCIKNKKIKTNLFFTRRELIIKEKLEKEIKKLYKENKIDKLNYYFYEYFNYVLNDKDEVYNKLIDSINNSFNEKHFILYKLMKLSYYQK